MVCIQQVFRTCKTGRSFLSFLITDTVSTIYSFSGNRCLFLICGRSLDQNQRKPTQREYENSTQNGLKQGFEPRICLLRGANHRTTVRDADTSVLQHISMNCLYFRWKHWHPAMFDLTWLSEKVVSPPLTKHSGLIAVDILIHMRAFHIVHCFTVSNNAVKKIACYVMLLLQVVLPWPITEGRSIIYYLVKRLTGRGSTNCYLDT